MAAGERSDRRRGRRGIGWPWLPVALVAVLAAVVVLVRACGDGGDDPPAATATEPGGTTVGRSQRRGTLVTRDGADVLTAAGQRAELARLAGEGVTADRVRVESVVGDEVFWVGSSATRRVLVRLALVGRASPRVRRGDVLRFTGTVAPLPPQPGARWGITAAEGVAQLVRHGHYVEANIGTVTVVD